MLSKIKAIVLSFFKTKKQPPLYIELLTPYHVDNLGVNGYHPELVVRYPYKEEHLNDVKDFIKRAIDEVVGQIATNNHLDLLKDGGDLVEDGRVVSGDVMTQALLATQSLSRLQLDNILNNYYIDIKKAKTLDELLEVKVKHKTLRRVSVFNMVTTVSK